MPRRYARARRCGGRLACSPSHRKAVQSRPTNRTQVEGARFSWLVPEGLLELGRFRLEWGKGFAHPVSSSLDGMAERLTPWYSPASWPGRTGPSRWAAPRLPAGGASRSLRPAARPKRCDGLPASGTCPPIPGASSPSTALGPVGWTSRKPPPSGGLRRRYLDWAVRREDPGSDGTWGGCRHVQPQRREQRLGAAGVIPGDGRRSGLAPVHPAAGRGLHGVRRFASRMERAGDPGAFPGMMAWLAEVGRSVATERLHWRLYAGLRWA